jgi:type VI secretion system secreted protein Hcp
MAYEFYVSVEGTTTGKFKGESTKEKQKDKIPGLSFEYAVRSPFDGATGNQSGKRLHEPIRFVKEWGASTPQFFHSLATNETLKKVTFEFWRTDPTGKQAAYYTITLENARVVTVKQFSSDVKVQGSVTSQRAVSSSANELEEISFVFQKITVENTQAKTSAMDDWESGR